MHDVLNHLVIGTTSVGIMAVRAPLSAASSLEPLPALLTVQQEQTESRDLSVVIKNELVRLMQRMKLTGKRLLGLAIAKCPKIHATPARPVAAGATRLHIVN